MGSESVELQWVMISTLSPDTNFGGWEFAEVRLWPVGGQIITVMGAALPTLPDSFTVSNQRLELDRFSTCEGSGQIRRLHRGISKTDSTWNLCNKDTPKTWLSGGPFKVGTDATTIFWSGTFTDDDPQVFTGNAALASYIEGKGEGNWVMFAVIATEIGATKILDGARLKFDYTAAGTPVLTGFSPTGIVSGETPVLTVTGSDLDADSLDAIELVGGSTYALTGIALDSSTRVHGTVPGGVTVGAYTVRVRIGGVDYDAPGSFSVSTAVMTLTNCYGDDGGVDFIHHYRRTLTCIGTTLTGLVWIHLLGLEGQPDYSLFNLDGVGSTEVTGQLLGPIAPGRYQVEVKCSAGTVYREIDVTLGPAWW